MDEYARQAREKIRENARGFRGISGIIICPNCCGSLKYVIHSGTGEIRGECSTIGCLKF